MGMESQCAWNNGEDTKSEGMNIELRECGFINLEHEWNNRRIS